MGAGNSPGSGKNLPTGINVPGTGFDSPSSGFNSPNVSGAAMPTSGLVLFAEADSGVTQSSNLVSQVLDKSGLGNTLTATGSGRPTYDATGANGHPQFTFDGVANGFDIANTLVSSASDRTVVLVGKLSSVASNNVVIRFRRAGNYFLFYSGVGGTPYIATNGTTYVIASSNFTSGSLRGLAWTVSSSNVGVIENGTAKGIASGNPITITEDGAAGAYVCSNGGSPGSFFTGSWSLLAVYNKILPTADKTSVNAYTFPKYGVNVF